MTPVYIVDIVKDAVTKTAALVLATIQAAETAALGTTLIETIDFQNGHKRELIETLIQMDKAVSTRTKKYPLVYLVQDFSEERGKEKGVYAETSLNIIIAHHTKDTYKITDREAKVFKPVLYPIYYELIHQLSKSKWTLQGNETMVRHRKTDRSYWGRNAVGGTDANKLTDFVDAIEIENLVLKIYYSNC